MKPSFVPTKWDDISDDEENGNDEQTIKRPIQMRVKMRKKL